MFKSGTKLSILTLSILILSACSSFTGIRTPRYDGRPIEADPEKIEAYENSNEIIGEAKEFYLPDSLSQEILAPSLDYVEHEPVLLEEGTYVIGEDLPAGRVTMNGEKNNPRLSFPSLDEGGSFGAPPAGDQLRVGTMYVRDEAGDLYFENMFHPTYGVLIVQVDFIEGHTIEIIGEQAEVVVFYAPELPADPYVFDTRQEEFDAQFEDLEEVEIVVSESVGQMDPMLFEPEQPLNISEEEQFIEVKAGIYEVGEHFDPGTYTMTQGGSPTATELYLFREGEDTRVFEISDYLYTRPWTLEEIPGMEENPPIIELRTGDKLYFSYIGNLTLTRVEE